MPNGSFATHWHFRFYDSVIITDALTAGCSRLQSEDLEDGQRIESLMIDNPFKR